MQNIKKYLFKQRFWLPVVITTLFTNISTVNSNEYVPYVYKPQAEELQQTGIKIAQAASDLIKFGQIKEAVLLAKLSVQLNPNDERLWAILAEAQIRSNKLEEANDSLEKARSINPKSASILFRQASIKLQDQKAKQAEILLRMGLDLEPKNAGAYFQLGNAKLMQGKLNNSLKEFENAVKLKPNFWEALNNQGLVLFELGKINNSIKIWNQVLKIKENAEPMLALASALNYLNPNNEKSIELTREALRLNPNYVASAYQKEQLWGEKLVRAAKKLFKNPKLLQDVEKALANADLKNG